MIGLATFPVCYCWDEVVSGLNAAAAAAHHA